MRSKLVWALTVALLWLSFVPTHEYGHCLLYWGSGQLPLTESCDVVFNTKPDDRGYLAIAEPGYHLSESELLGHHIALYGLGFIQAILLPIILYPRK